MAEANLLNVIELCFLGFLFLLYKLQRGKLFSTKIAYKTDRAKQLCHKHKNGRNFEQLRPFHEQNVIFFCYAFLLFFLVNNIIRPTRNLQSFRVFFNERVDMSHTLLVENLVDSDEDARLLHVTKPIVDGGAEELHRG